MKSTPNRQSTPSEQPHNPAPWRTGTYPQTIACTAMLYPDEIAYLHWVGAQAATRTGNIIDLGAFVGGSSLSLAQGSQTTTQSPPHIHAYDVFHVTQSQHTHHLVPGAVGDSYLELYKSNLHNHLHRITTHTGYIPQWAQHPDELAAIYPAAQPVSTLFIDCAKAWGVHHSILRAFGPHLRDGSIVIQQDFKSILVYLAIHMYQLRNTLTPAHFPDGGTVGFIANAPLTTTDLDALWTPQDIDTRGRIQTISKVADWFQENTPEHLAPWIWLAAAATPQWADDHAFIQTCINNAKTTLDQHEPTDPNRDIIRRENWNSEVHRLASILSADNNTTQAQHTQATLLLPDTESHHARQREQQHAFRTLWNTVEQQCLDNGWYRIALYASGRHTAKLLAHAWPRHPRLNVVAILEDNPAKVGHHIAGIRVILPNQAHIHQPDVIIPSSDAHESRIWDACQRLAQSTHAATIRIYTAPPNES